MISRVPEEGSRGARLEGRGDTLLRILWPRPSRRLPAAGSSGTRERRLFRGGATTAIGFELQVIAAVVIGGTSLSGGRGGIFGTLIGTLIIGVISNVMNLMNVTAFWQYIVIGSIIVLAALINELSKRYQNRR